MTDFLLVLPVLLFSVVAHEYAHAWTAYRQGDPTAHMLGRLTLNPLPHIDPMMSVIFPAMLFWLSSLAGHPFTFGAAKPVPVNPRNYRNYRRGDLIVSSAGIVTNLGLALACGAVFAGLGVLGAAAPGAVRELAILQRMMFYGVFLNFVLAVFNLVPLPPLDGSHLFYHLLPPALGARYRQVGRFGFLILLVTFMVPGLSRIWDVVLWPAAAASGAVLSVVFGLALPGALRGLL